MLDDDLLGVKINYKANIEQQQKEQQQKNLDKQLSEFQFKDDGRKSLKNYPDVNNLLNQYRAVEGADYYKPKFTYLSDLDLNDNIQLKKLRASSLYWYRNSPYVSGAIKQFVSQILQKEGITVEPTPFFLQDGESTLDIELSKTLKTFWSEFGIDVQFDRDYVDLHSFLARVLTCYLRDGEIFIQVISNHKPYFGLRCFTADELDYSTGKTGIKYNDAGEPVKYCFGRKAPNGKIKYFDIPANEILALQNIESITQLRGIPVIAPCLKDVHDLDRLITSLVNQGYMQSKFFGIIEDKRQFNDIDLYSQILDTDVSIDSSPDGQLNMFTMPHGREFKQYGMSTGNIDWINLIDQLIHNIAVGSGLGFEYVSQKFVSSYSAARQSALNTDNVIARHTKNLISSVLRPLYRKFIDHLINTRQLTLTKKYISINRANYQEPRRPSIDPNKDAKALQVGLQSGQIPLSTALAQNGSNVNDFANDLSKSLKVFEQAGIDKDILFNFLGYYQQVSKEVDDGDDNDDGNDGNDGQDNVDGNNTKSVRKTNVNVIKKRF